MQSYPVLIAIICQKVVIPVLVDHHVEIINCYDNATRTQTQIW